MPLLDIHAFPMEQILIEHMDNVKNALLTSTHHVNSLFYCIPEEKREYFVN